MLILEIEGRSKTPSAYSSLAKRQLTNFDEIISGSLLTSIRMSILWHLARLLKLAGSKRKSDYLARRILSLTAFNVRDLAYHRLASLELGGTVTNLIQHLNHLVRNFVATGKGLHQLTQAVNFAVQANIPTTELEKLLQPVFRVDQNASVKSGLKMLDLVLHLNFSHTNGGGSTIQDFITFSNSLVHQEVEIENPLEYLNWWSPWISGFTQFPQVPIKEINSRIAHLVLAAWPELDYTAPHTLVREPRITGRRKLGFYYHPTMPMLSGVLECFPKEDYEIFFLHHGDLGDSNAAKTWVQRSHKTVKITDANPILAQRQIGELKLDVLISGPFQTCMWMAMLGRLAKLQMILIEPSWLDGTRNLDYYVSWAEAEPQNLNTFYSNAVALTSNPPYFFEKSIVSPSKMTPHEVKKVRARFGLPNDKRIYLCPSTIQKLSVDLDEVVSLILDEDSDGFFVFLRSETIGGEGVKSRLNKRLREHFSRVVFLETLSEPDAHSLLMAVDCVIDSFPINGMSSNFAAIALGVPVVTLGSENPFGRWSRAIYKYIGQDGLVAKDANSMATLAINVAKNPELRDELRGLLLERSNKYVGSWAGSIEFKAFVEDAWSRYEMGLPPEDWIRHKWIGRESS